MWTICLKTPAILMSFNFFLTLEFLKGISENGERFKFYHRVLKTDGTLAAEVEIYGAWLDLKERKLTRPPDKVMKALEDIERTEDFEDIPLKKN